ncbi:phytanoyl-CoA dioxygenase family protein [Embleya sp. AB8]|uniref:phytanoyl-CoA dioxygenase family protein n=1 Tax=Embleya sp. AB8 TaxID=3156304 RepID=UPI003C76F9BF
MGESPEKILGSRREQWNQNGYIHIRKALSDADVERALAGVDVAVRRRDRVRTTHVSYRNDQEHSIRVRNAVAAGPALLDLVDHPGVLPTLVELLGPDLHVLGSEAFVREGGAAPLEGWHTDGGASLMGIVLDPASRALQLKVQYFLTDVSRPDSGNFTVIPGSHRTRPERLDDDCYLPGPNDHWRRGEMPPDAVQILAEPGDAVVFPYNLWHAVAPNSRGLTRRSVIIRYGHLWCRPLDFDRMPADVVAAMSERQRLIFGELGEAAHPTDFYKLVMP